MIKFNLEQAKNLVEFFDGEETEIEVIHTELHSGLGLYANYSEHPEEEAFFLGQDT